MAQETKGGTYIDANSNKDKGHVNIYDKDPKGPHDSIHINIDYNTGKGTIVEKSGGEKTTTDIGCYLTTACMRFFNDKFDDHCEELETLRWFRDTFVSKEDIDHYYETAPVIVAAINESENPNAAYEYIYNNVVAYCVERIKNGNYEAAYNRYKSSVLALEETYARPYLQSRLVKVLQQ